MVQRFCFTFLLGLTLVGSIGSASAFGPIASGALVSAQPDVQKASFFGRPYPHGYTGWGPCVRYVEVETRWGLRLRRVNICR